MKKRHSMQRHMHGSRPWESLWLWIKEEMDLSPELEVVKKIETSGDSEKKIIYNLVRIVGKIYIDLSITGIYYVDDLVFQEKAGNSLANPVNMNKYLTLVNEKRVVLTETILVKEQVESNKE